LQKRAVKARGTDLIRWITIRRLGSLTGGALRVDRFDPGSKAIWTARSRSDGERARMTRRRATGSPPASGDAWETSASRLDLRLGGTIRDGVCAEAKLATQGIDPWH
jgi:hypothetical protein